MMKQESAAARRTKSHLQQALLELVKNKGFHHVTVKDIVEQSDYNRTTFYLYYHDKYDLSDALIAEKLSGLEQAVGSAYFTGQLVHTQTMGTESFALLHYIKQHRAFFDLLFVPDTLPGLVHQFPETIEKIYQEQFSFQTLNDLPVDMELFKRYMANGLYGLIRDWIQTNYAKEEQQFINELIQLSQAHIATYTFFGQTKKDSSQ